MKEYKGKYTVYDNDGKVVIISRRKEVAMNYAKDYKNVTSN